MSRKNQLKRIAKMFPIDGVKFDTMLESHARRMELSLVYPDQKFLPRKLRRFKRRKI